MNNGAVVYSFAAGMAQCSGLLIQRRPIHLVIYAAHSVHLLTYSPSTSADIINGNATISIAAQWSTHLLLVRHSSIYCYWHLLGCCGHEQHIMIYSWGCSGFAALPGSSRRNHRDSVHSSGHGLMVLMRTTQMQLDGNHPVLHISVPADGVGTRE